MTLSPAGALAPLLDAWSALGRLGGVTVAAAALLFVPGLAAALALRRRAALADAADVLAAAPCLGMLAVPLAWWAADLADVPVGPVLTLAALVAAVGVAAIVLWRALPPTSPLPLGAASRPEGQGQGQGSLASAADALPLVLLFFLTLVTRLAVVRDLALPAWVDGVHHTYIVRRMLELGAIPEDYRPLLDFGPFAYHFGFHALAASAAQLSGAAPPDAAIGAGQLLSAMAVPAAYLLARLYRARPLGALAAGAAAGLVSMMPAYYVSWSRFTEMAGLVALPAFLLLARRAPASPVAAAVAGLAAAGLLLVHPRVFLMAALLVLVDLLVQPERWPGRRRLVVLSPLVGLLVAAPWLRRLVGELVPRLGLAAPGLDAANALDPAPLATHHDPWLYGLAVAAVVAGLTAGNLGAWTMVAWAALVFVAANPGLLGLPGTYMLSNGSVVISLWLPAAAAIGCGVGAAADALARRAGPRVFRLARVAAPLAVVVVALALDDAPLAALNQTTVLATSRDRRMFDQLGQLVSPGALVAVNVREWQFRTFMGTDGGYWIGVVTPGRALVPPLLYGLEPPAQAIAISDRLIRWDADAHDGPALASQMRQMGAVWLYIGERGGDVDPAVLTPDAGFELVREDGPVRLYRLR